MHYSPLRYPGGKAKLAPLMKLLIEKTGHQNGVFIEALAGGAGIALDCLFSGAVPKIVINDADGGVYSFWRAILDETDRFINDVMTVPITVDQRELQRDRYKALFNRGYSYELGFATFYLNRTNRSGIIKGGAIGGNEQGGTYKLGARFNREALAEKICNIAAHKEQIDVYCEDFREFLPFCEMVYAGNALVYLDPPYYQKGKQLYTKYFTEDDHMALSQFLRKPHDLDWVLSYDDCPEVSKLYWGFTYRDVIMNYSLARKRHTKEVMFFSNDEMIPTKQELEAREIKMIFDESLNTICSG